MGRMTLFYTSQLSRMRAGLEGTTPPSPLITSDEETCGTATRATVHAQPQSREPSPGPFVTKSSRTFASWPTRSRGRSSR